jgi:hypothetical protein
MSRRSREVRFLTTEPNVGAATYEMDENEKEALMKRLATIGGVNVHLDAEIYNPPESKRFSKKGAWVMLLRIPNVEIKRRLCRAMIFYARHDAGTDQFGFNQRGLYKVKITTPWSDLWLWPYEYSVMEPTRVIELYQEGDLIFHPKKEGLNFTDALVYVMSRGIPMEQAIPMVLGSFEGDVGWFEPKPSMKKQIEATFG